MKWTDYLPTAELITSSYRSQCPDGFDVYNTGIALGIGIATVAISAGATAYAASEQAGAASAANETNRINAMNDRQLNYELNRQSRGSQGNAILPIYSTDANGKPIEPQLLADAYGTYQATAGSTSPEALANMRALASQTAPAQLGAVRDVNALFSGDRANEMVGNQQPVYQARTSLATASKNAKLEALKQTINENQMRMAKQGFSGDNTEARRIAFVARRDANTSGAIDMGQAKLANATDEATLRNQNVDLRLQNLSLPYAIGQQSINLANLPSRSLIENQNARLGSLGFFNIGTNQFQYQPLPQVQPVASTGQIVGQAVAAGANAYGQYNANQQAISAQQQSNADYINALRGLSGQSGSYIARTA